MTKQALLQLADRCEAPVDHMSSPLDADIALAIGWKFDPSMPFWWKAPDSITWVMSPPAYTTSLDAALTLVPEGWMLDHLGDNGHGEAGAMKITGATAEVTNGLTSLFQGDAATRPLALCAAALRARAALPEPPTMEMT